MNQFTITSGAMRVTDPCYEVDTWCAGELANVMNGTWNASVRYFKDPNDFYNPVKFVKRELERQLEFYTLMKNEKPESGDLYVVMAEQQKQRYAEKIKTAQKYPGRVSQLMVWHESVGGGEDVFNHPHFFHKTDIHVGVDSGQAGFFDRDRYAEYGGDPGDGNRDAYFAICDLTGSGSEYDHPQFGTNEWGAVSSSGYGDGGYDLYVLRHDQTGQVIAAYILYIDPNFSSDDDEEFDEETDQSALTSE